MPAAFLLATLDDELASAWQQQLPAGSACVRLGELAQGPLPVTGLPLVVIADASLLERLPVSPSESVLVVVGQPRSLPFEQARMAGRARTYLSFEESRTRLRESASLLAELAEKQAMVSLLADRARRPEPVRPATRAPFSTGNEAWEVWDFIEGALESLDSRERLLAEFRRASRTLLRASHTVFFLRDGDVLRADRGTSICAVDDPLVAYLTAHPTLVDGHAWTGPADPIAELAIRQRLALWGARLLAPLHDGTQLVGLMAVGVRDDGQPYEEGDRSRALCLARLLRQALGRVHQIQRLQTTADRSRLSSQYLPNTLILGPDESPPRTVPLVVRSLVGEVRRLRETRRVSATAEQPFRASAGLISETGGIWSFWEEVSGEIHDSRERARRERISLLRELALTLNHELGNALVSMSALRHMGVEPPKALLQTAFSDVGKLEELNGRFHVMQSLAELQPVNVDLREIVQQVSTGLETKVEVVPEPVRVTVEPKLVSFALESLLKTLAENRPAQGLRNLSVQLRVTGDELDTTALISIKGQELELEGILPEPVITESVPNQGRLGVFLAKEIIRLHGGEIHAGPGMEGTEILISLRSL